MSDLSLMVLSTRAPGWRRGRGEGIVRVVTSDLIEQAAAVMVSESETVIVLREGAAAGDIAALLDPLLAGMNRPGADLPMLSNAG